MTINAIFLFLAVANLLYLCNQVDQLQQEVDDLLLQTTQDRKTILKLIDEKCDLKDRIRELEGDQE